MGARAGGAGRPQPGRRPRACPTPARLSPPPCSHVTAPPPSARPARPPARRASAARPQPRPPRERRGRRHGRAGPPGPGRRARRAQHAGAHEPVRHLGGGRLQPQLRAQVRRRPPAALFPRAPAGHPGPATGDLAPGSPPEACTRDRPPRTCTRGPRPGQSTRNRSLWDPHSGPTPRAVAFAPHLGHAPSVRTTPDAWMVPEVLVPCSGGSGPGFLRPRGPPRLSEAHTWLAPNRHRCTCLPMR